jgi:hypothetical protein
MPKNIQKVAESTEPVAKTGVATRSTMEETFHQWSRTPDVGFIEGYSGVHYQRKLLGDLLYYKLCSKKQKIR